MIMGKPKNKSGKPGKSFTLFHCFDILENEEKWKNRSSTEIPNKRKTPSSSVDTDEGSSIPTPLSSVTRKRSEGRKKAKEIRAKGGDIVYKESLDNMMEMRKELANERRELKHREIEERKDAVERRVATKERMAAAKERLAEVEERKVANDEIVKRMEHEHKIMFMDSNGLDEKARAYLEICRDQILMSKGYGGVKGGGNGGNNGGYGAI
jgi:hypothetical protein